MALDMTGVVGNFARVACTLVTEDDGDYDSDGIWQSGGTTETSFNACVAPYHNKEIETLDLGSERVIGAFSVYPEHFIQFKMSPYIRIKMDLGGGERTYRVVQTDVRPWNNYCKIMCNLLDE